MTPMLITARTRPRCVAGDERPRGPHNRALTHHLLTAWRGLPGVPLSDVGAAQSAASVGLIKREASDCPGKDEAGWERGRLQPRSAGDLSLVGPRTARHRRHTPHIMMSHPKFNQRGNSLRA